MSIKSDLHILSYDLELLTDKLRKVWQDFVAGKITPDTAGKLMYTENAELDAKIGKLGVVHIYKGRGEIMKFLDWITKRTQPGPLDCTTELETSTQLTRNCIAFIDTNFGTIVLDLENTINKGDKRIEKTVLKVCNGPHPRSNYPFFETVPFR